MVWRICSGCGQGFNGDYGNLCDTCRVQDTPDIPVGTRMKFNQSSAPTGWTFQSEDAKAPDPPYLEYCKSCGQLAIKIDGACLNCGEGEPKNQKPESSHLGNRDHIDNPSHYTSHPSGVECIQITEHMNFCLGNAIKYIWRHDQKGGLDDLKKARFYLEREINRLEE